MPPPQINSILYLSKVVVLLVMEQVNLISQAVLSSKQQVVEHMVVPAQHNNRQYIVITNYYVIGGKCEALIRINFMLGTFHQPKVNSPFRECLPLCD